MLARAAQVLPRSHAAVMAEVGQGSNAAKEELGSGRGSGRGIGRGKGHGESHAKERGGESHEKKCGEGHAKERGEGHAEGSGESDDNTDRSLGGWQFTHGADAEGTCYVVTFCRRQPSVVGIWCRTCWPWDQFQKQLPTGNFISSGAKLKRFENADDGIDFFRATRHGSKAADRDGQGLKPVRFCNCNALTN